MCQQVQAPSPATEAAALYSAEHTHLVCFRACFSCLRCRRRALSFLGLPFGCCCWCWYAAWTGGKANVLPPPCCRLLLLALLPGALLLPPPPDLNPGNLNGLRPPAACSIRDAYACGQAGVGDVGGGPLKPVAPCLPQAAAFTVGTATVQSATPPLSPRGPPCVFCWAPAPLAPSVSATRTSPPLLLLSKAPLLCWPALTTVTSSLLPSCSAVGAYIASSTQQRGRVWGPLWQPPRRLQAQAGNSPRHSSKCASPQDTALRGFLAAAGGEIPGDLLLLLPRPVVLPVWERPECEENEKGILKSMNATNHTCPKKWVKH